MYFPKRSCGFIFLIKVQSMVPAWELRTKFVGFVPRAPNGNLGPNLIPNLGLPAHNGKYTEVYDVCEWMVLAVATWNSAVPLSGLPD